MKSDMQQGLCTLIERTSKIRHVHRDLTAEMYRARLVPSFCEMHSDDRKAKMLFSTSSEPRLTLIERDSARHRVTITVFTLNMRTTLPPHSNSVHFSFVR